MGESGMANFALPPYIGVWVDPAKADFGVNSIELAPNNDVPATSPLFRNVRRSMLDKTLSFPCVFVISFSFIRFSPFPKV
jgi:hypothetical protein